MHNNKLELNKIAFQERVEEFLSQIDVPPAIAETRKLSVFTSIYF